MADYEDVLHVPVLMTGTWNASTGREPITEEDLRSIVEAYASKMLDSAILKKGHTDPRFNNYLEDGEPAYGQVVNPVIEGDTLYVDYIHVPAELAESMKSAYPRCSVELARNVELHDAEGNLKAQFPVALTAVALLGATPPAVKGLSTRASALAEDEYESRTTIVTSQFAFPGNNTASSLASKLQAKVAAEHGGDYTWVFVEDFTDEAVVFAVESESDLVYYRRTYTADQDGAVTLTGELTPVVKETRWAVEKNADTTTNTPTPAPALAHAMSEAPEDTDPPASPEGEKTMPAVDKDQAAALRRKYGLPNNASHEDILAAVLADDGVAKVVTRPENTPPGTDDSLDVETRTEAQREEQDANAAAVADPLLSEAPAAEKQTVPAPTPASLPEPDVAALAEKLNGQYVSASAFAQFQAQHQDVVNRLAAREAAETKNRRDGMVKEWFRSGRVGPDEVKTVREALDDNEALTASLIGGRPQMFSTSEVGHAKLDTEHFALDTDETMTAAQLEADDAIFGKSIK